MNIPENYKNNIFYICSNHKFKLLNRIAARLKEYQVAIPDIQNLSEAVAILLLYRYDENETAENKIKQCITNVAHMLNLACFDNDYFFALYSDYIKEVQQAEIYENGLQYLFDLDGFSKKTEDLFYFVLNEIIDVTLVPRSVLREEVVGYAEVIEIKQCAESAKTAIEEYLHRYIEKKDSEIDAIEAFLSGDMKIPDIDEPPKKKPDLTLKEQEVQNIAKRCEAFMKQWTPETIAKHINKYIAGQEYAVNTFSQMIYEHIVRIAFPEAHIKKSNYVMFGPTGCGKTEMVKIASKIIPIPIEVVDASSITSQGFKGLDKEDVMGKLLEKDKENIEYAIIVLDEFDKLCYKRSASGGDDVNKSIQFDLLKMIEGTTLYINYLGNRDTQIPIKTDNITFVCAGAFDGAFSADIKNAFGFGAVNIDKNKDKTIMECLIDFGMVPELAGRISTVIPVRQLSKDDLYEILTQKEDNCITSIVNLYKYGYNTTLEFQDAALREICDVALKQKLGARGLQGIVEAVCHSNLKKNTHIEITEKMVSDVYRTLNTTKDVYFR